MKKQIRQELATKLEGGLGKQLDPFIEDDLEEQIWTPLWGELRYSIWIRFGEMILTQLELQAFKGAEND